MSVCNFIVERTHLYLQIHLIFHLSFPETQRVNILFSHQPLCMIHQIMRMSINISKFLIVVFIIFSPSFDHDDDSFIVYLSKTHVFDDLAVDEVETLQVVEALQPELMVMSSLRCVEVDSTLDQKSNETPKAPHHSPIYIEDQSSLEIPHPPPESHDPIAHALEESYTTRTFSKCKLSLFLIFSHVSWPKECTCLSSVHNVMHNHDTSAEFLSCAFILFFSVDIFKLEACWSSLLYFSCLLVYMLTFLINYAFTNIGQPMHR